MKTVARGSSAATRSASKRGEEEHATAGEQRAVERHEETVRVEDRQRVQQHVARFEAPQRDQRLRRSPRDCGGSAWRPSDARWCRRCRGWRRRPSPARRRPLRLGRALAPAQPGCPRRRRRASRSPRRAPRAPPARARAPRRIADEEARRGSRAAGRPSRRRCRPGSAGRRSRRAAGRPGSRAGRRATSPPAARRGHPRATPRAASSAAQPRGCRRRAPRTRARARSGDSRKMRGGVRRKAAAEERVEVHEADFAGPSRSLLARARARAAGLRSATPRCASADRRRPPCFCRAFARLRLAARRPTGVGLLAVAALQLDAGALRLLLQLDAARWCGGAPRPDRRPAAACASSA